jgi:integrase
MGPSGPVPGIASLHLVDGVALLRPEEQVFEGMLAGFANQQLARNLARSVHEWNTAVHVQDGESDAKKRAFTKAELHAFFAHCDDEVARARAFGRKGWLPAFRDAALFKTAYAYGLRRNETRMLDAADSAATRTGPSSASSACVGSGSARPRRARRPSAAAC